MNELGTALRRKGWVFRDGQWWKEGVRVGNPGEVAKLEQASGNEPLATPRPKENTGPTFLIRVTSKSYRLLDEDNLSEKYVVDLCRYSGVIPDDDPGHAKIEVCQEKISRNEKETVRIEVWEIR